MGQGSSEASGPPLPELRPAFPAGVHMAATAVCLDSSSGGLGVTERPGRTWGFSLTGGSQLSFGQDSSTEPVAT